MKFILLLFVFLFFILGMAALIGVWVIKGLSDFFSGIFKNPAQNNDILKGRKTVQIILL